jgi:hypothetical protein
MKRPPGARSVIAARLSNFVGAWQSSCPRSPLGVLSSIVLVIISPKVWPGADAEGSDQRMTIVCSAVEQRLRELLVGVPGWAKCGRRTRSPESSRSVVTSPERRKLTWATRPSTRTAVIRTPGLGHGCRPCSLVPGRPRRLRHRRACDGLRNVR